MVMDIEVYIVNTEKFHIHWGCQKPVSHNAEKPDQWKFLI